MKLYSFLNKTLKVLKEDHPKRLEEMVSEGLGVTYLQVLDKEKAIIKIRRSGIRLSRSTKQPGINIRVYISRNCLFDLLEGRETLEEAFSNGRLKVFGDPLTILRCYGIWESVISIARTSPRLYFLTYKLR